uniref:Nuclear protein MDM1 n=1 Tax=Monopterus albus TaxID=43700 RepID=A0A3Q3IDT9_MONAL
MTVRFKCQSEYQKSYGAPRSRSVSPQRSAPLAGLRSDQMGISSEPGLQRRKRLSAGGLAQSCTSLLCPSDHLAELTPDAHRNAPPAAASRSRSSQRKKPSLEPKPLTPPGSRAEPGFQTGPETAAGPRPAADKGSPSRPRPARDPGPSAESRPAADPGPPAGPRPARDPGPSAESRPAADPRPPAGPQLARDPGPSAESRPAADPGPPAGPRPARDPGPSGEPVALGKSVKPHPSQPDSQSQPSHPLIAAPDGQQPLANAGERALRWRAGLRSGDQRSEYHRQFNWKKPAAAASPILTAEQVMFSSSRSVPPYKKNPVPMETEYQRSFQGLVPPSGSRLCKHLEHQRVPLFHTYMTHKRRRKESQKKPRHKQDAPQRDNTRSPHPPAQVQRGHRILTEYESSFRSPLYSIPEEGRAMDASASQVKELRQAALSYRRRAWGTNFSRDHLSQLQSEHNALWEPMDNTDSASDPPTPRLTFDLGRDEDSRSTSCVEALDLTSRSSNSSKRSSVAGPGEVHHTNQSAAGDMHTKAQTPANPPARMAWEEEEEEEEATDEEEGRLPTPSLKMRPVQRTHHDITTPATGTHRYTLTYTHTHSAHPTDLGLSSRWRYTGGKTEERTLHTNNR